MSTWMVIGCIWTMCAFCVVLFIRGAAPHIAHENGEMGELAHVSIDDSSRMKADRGRA